MTRGTRNNRTGGEGIPSRGPSIPAVALMERHYLGGDWLNVGCVPSKCIIRSS